MVPVVESRMKKPGVLPSEAAIWLLRRLNFTEDERARAADFGQLRTDQYFAFGRKNKSNVLAVAKENSIASRQGGALAAGSQQQQATAQGWRVFASCPDRKLGCDSFCGSWF
jgi:hypothetical protein